MRRSTVLIAAASLATATVVASHPHADAATQPLQFRRFVVETKIPGTDPTTNTYLNRETIALTNTSTTKAYNLKGYVIYDRGNHFRYTFPSLTLRPRATVTLHTGKGSISITNVYWNKTGYVWNNDGDTATLNNAAGHAIESCVYYKVKAGYKTC
ncbi:lamin tail domain-containing protein [Luteipulveratus mongoliensis]|uniref:LTD domain-containing protein n=1 Tax=Luteipulveratus mongoliensis TaxID=571913 RepID=A0A0K1JGY9_9MICO|nr:lamin tail domain-containing protein [Luteipulveratus mongoliensis]AKU15971.1 hypothetical protein VV02_09085 [Luteipulveratus mongoliensis]